ncbi:hypothetical protein AAC861_001619 [Vibrio cholerae]
MSHLYFNTKIDHEIESYLLENKKKHKVNINGFDSTIYYDALLWSNAIPVIQDGNKTLFVSGWFINSDYELNNIQKLYNDLSSMTIKDVVDNIIAGIFIAGYFDGENLSIFCDPFGLTPHYYCCNGDLIISPSIMDINKEKVVKKDLDIFLQQQGHLFSKYTKYDNIFKFIPGDHITIAKGNIKYTNNGFNINTNNHSVSDVLDLSDKIIKCFPQDSLSVALSAGFDSRLIFLSSEAKYTYTWGQNSSLDVINARALAKKSGAQHLKFDFRENKVSPLSEYVCNYLFDGSVLNYNPQFIENYRYVSNASCEKNIALDGYLGDVLQRGVYMTHAGKKGEILKLFPFVSEYFLDSGSLLNSRYHKVSENLKDLLFEEFEEKTKNVLNVDELQKVTYFEFLYGRGLRYITTASIYMNSLHKTIVPVFASRYIFSVLVTQSSKDTLRYKTFIKIWNSAPKYERGMKSEGFYSPATSRPLIPILNLIGRISTNFIPKYMNYTKK